MQAPRPIHEQERLEALRRYGVLDTSAETDFDAITRVIASICQAPIALISLVDEGRQWFKSSVGLDLTETPLDASICAHAILQPESLVVPDTLADPRFADNPLVCAGPGLRFYAGAVLETSDGHALGTLCVMDRVPRVLEPVQRQALEVLARQVVIQLELRRSLIEQTEAKDHLERTALALRRSKEDLERFAYAVGHDLKSPLQTITNFTELLGERYRSRLDDEAHELMGYIVGGVRRIGALLDALLEYAAAVRPDDSAVGLVPCGPVMEKVMRDLEPVVRRSQAKVEWDLPAVPVREVHLVQLFQNLIGNAIKYRGEEPPRIVIAAKRQDADWLFSVRDNGIGIDPAYAEQVFGLFKRLHGDRYPGTGIGLAICNTIIERYGGRMWVDSRPGAGSTFYFTVPAA